MLPEKVTLQQRSEGGRKHEDTWGRRVPAERIARTKGLGQECVRVCMGGGESGRRGGQNNKAAGTCHLKLHFGSSFNVGLGRLKYVFKGPNRTN